MKNILSPLRNSGITELLALRASFKRYILTQQRAEWSTLLYEYSLH